MTTLPTQPKPDPGANLKTGVRAGAAAALLACSLMLWVPSAAFGQAAAPSQTQSVKPPAPQQPSKPPVLSNLLIASVVVVSIVAATVIPAKRGHQD